MQQGGGVRAAQVMDGPDASGAEPQLPPNDDTVRPSLLTDHLISRHTCQCWRYLEKRPPPAASAAPSIHMASSSGENSAGAANSLAQGAGQSTAGASHERSVPQGTSTAAGGGAGGWSGPQGRLRAEGGEGARVDLGWSTTAGASITIDHALKAAARTRLHAYTAVSVMSSEP